MMAKLINICVYKIKSSFSSHNNITIIDLYIENSIQKYIFLKCSRTILVYLESSGEDSVTIIFLPGVVIFFNILLYFMMYILERRQYNRTR